MDTATESTGPLPILEQWSKAEQAATKGPWSVRQRHGVDIADEGWSEVKITAPGGDIAATFISHVLENYHDGDDADFIVVSRTAMPRLLAIVAEVLKAHRPNTADGRCNWCRDPDGQRSAFPCGEYLTIKRILLGEEADHA